MESIITNDFLNSVLEAEAWKEVSRSESFSMTMIEKFADKLDWEEVSGNSNVIWTVEGINKFANKIHWDEFSRSCPENLISETTLQKFASKWDWNALSNRDDIYNNWHLLEMFADKVIWSEIITNWNIEKNFGVFRSISAVHPHVQTSGLPSVECNGRSSRQTFDPGSHRNIMKNAGTQIG